MKLFESVHLILDKLIDVTWCLLGYKRFRLKYAAFELYWVSFRFG